LVSEQQHIKGKKISNEIYHHPYKSMTITVIQTSSLLKMKAITTKIVIMRFTLQIPALVYSDFYKINAITEILLG